MVMATTGLAPALAQPAGGSTEPVATSGPIRLRQPQVSSKPETEIPARPKASGQRPSQIDANDDREISSPRSKPSEFEAYLTQLANGQPIRRFGVNLVLDQAGNDGNVSDVSPVIPSDYVVGPGDELLLTMWGAVDADVRLLVDRSGRVQIPRIGSVLVAGSRYQDLTSLIDRQAKRLFKNYELAVTLGQLRGIQVYVTGFAERPGIYSVSSLATASTVLFKAGGPSASGSFRQIELRRGGQTVAKLDLYDLLVHGRRNADVQVQAGDVLHVGPVGLQAAVLGSANTSALFDIKQSETLDDLLQMAGGFNAVADRTRVALEQLGERSDVRVRQLAWPAERQAVVQAGDVLRVFSAISTALPQDRQNKRVRIEGEVVKPGEYIVPPKSSMADLLRLAGGYTGQAFLYGADFTRESVRRSQQLNYERALRDMEVSLSRRASANNVRSAEEVASQAAQQAANERLLQRLRDIKPTGRVVLQIPTGAKDLPDLVLEDGDRLLIPAQPSTVGVFGSVFNAGSFLFGSSRTVDDYLRLAGSPTRDADQQSIFVVRANGSVISAQQSQGAWLSFGGGNGNLGNQTAQPGDTIYVPEEATRTTFLQGAKDWTQVLYQLGVGLAAILTATR